MLQRHDHLMVQLLLLAAAASVGANAVAAVAGGAAAASAGSGRPSESEPAPYIIDVADTFGAITFETLVNATAAGIAALGKHAYVTVKISAGTHVIDCQGDLFTVEGVQTQGEFAIEGAGMEQTVLLLKQGMHNMIKGDSFQNIAWRDLTFSHTTGQTTRGKVVDVSTTSVTLDVPRGFPSPQEILSFRYPRLRPDQGLYLLQYTTTAPGSVRVPAKLTDFPTAVNHTVHSVLPKFNAHLPYTCSLNATPAINTTSQGYVCDAVQDLGDGRWKFEVGSSAWAALRPLYKAAIARQDIVVGVKAKRGGQAYALGNGDGVKFERVRWQGHSRGIIQNSNRVLFNQTNVSPMPPPAPGGLPYTTATNGGGPQIKASRNVLVLGHTSQSSGDDSLAFFDIESGMVTTCVINDGWGAGMLLSNLSAGFSVRGNTVRRTPIYYPDKSGPPPPPRPPPPPGPPASPCNTALAKCVGERKCKECAKDCGARGSGLCTKPQVQAWIQTHCDRPASYSSRESRTPQR